MVGVVVKIEVVVGVVGGVGGVIVVGVGGVYGDILGYEGVVLGSVDMVNVGVMFVEYGLVLFSGFLIYGGIGGYGGMNLLVIDVLVL